MVSTLLSCGGVDDAVTVLYKVSQVWGGLAIIRSKLGQNCGDYRNYAMHLLPRTGWLLKMGRWLQRCLQTVCRETGRWNIFESDTSFVTLLFSEELSLSYFGPVICNEGKQE